MTCKDDKTYPYPITNVFGNGSLLTVYNGCGYQGVTASDFLVGAQLGLLGGLVEFEDGTILKVVDGKFVESGLIYNEELGALVFSGKIIADELEVSTDTIFLSQRIAIEAFGNSIEFKDNFINDRRLPLYTKINERGSLGNFAVQVGAEQSITIQDLFDVNNTNANYSPPDTPGQAISSNVSRGHYRFSEAGVNARIRVIATNEDGERFVQFGTEAYPFKEFVSVAYNGTEASETIVVYPAGIYNTEGLTYETYIETFDPETREASGEPLNILGATGSGIFRAYVVVDLQIVTEIELAGGGDVIGLGASAAGDIAVFEDASGKIIKSTGVQLSSLAGALTEVASDSTIDGLGTVASPLGVNLKTQIIDDNTVEIYEANDSVDRFFYAGDQDATIKLRSLDSEYNDRCRFEIYNDSGYNLTLTENDGTEIQRIRNGFAFEFFYDDGWGFGLIRRLGAQGIEIDVANISQFQLNGFYANKTVVFVHGTTPTVNDLDVTIEPFSDFSTGDSLTIIKDSSIGFPFINVDYERGNGSFDSEVVTGTITAERRQQRWQIISNDANTNIAIVNNVDTPYDTRAMSANAFSVIATVYAENVAVSEKLAENGIDRLLTVDLNQFASQDDLIESLEANNDLILAPNDGVEFYLKDSNKDLGYGLNNVSTYFQPADGPIDLNASTYLDYGQVYAVHKNVGAKKCLMMMHESLVAELWGQSVVGIDKLSVVIKSGAKASLGKANKTAPTGGVWNYQGFAIDIATTSDNANTTNPTKYLKDDGTEATAIADYARAIYSPGTFKNDNSTLLARGFVNFTVDTATPNTFTSNSSSDYFVCSVDIGGGTFSGFKMMPVFMTKSNISDMYDRKAVLFDDAASAVGELLTISYEGAEDASAIIEAAKTSDSFGEFKQKIEDTTITLTETL